MRYIEDKEEKRIAEKYIKEAKDLAQQATCLRAKCGAVIVQKDEIIGRGFNSPPGNNEGQRRCALNKKEYDYKVTDKTCCMHAEQRAVLNALKGDAGKLKGAKLYFARFYPDGTFRLTGGNEGKNQLYCTVCTKLMYEVGIEEFILTHVKGIGVYDRNEYLDRSFNYGKYSLD